jgi:o-succinylbenzoate---CoA ligase
MTALDCLQNYHDRRGPTNDHRPWLTNTKSTTLIELVNQYSRSIAQLSSGAVIFLAEPDPIRFLAAWVAAASAPCRLILCNPDWQTQEWTQLAQLITPTLIIGNAPIAPHPTASSIPQLPEQAILIPTGGTSGQLKFAIHTWDTLTAAVHGLTQYFQIPQINSCCVLPLYHVSGLMQALRSLITGGQITIHPWKSLASGILPPTRPHSCLSLVPTQLLKLLDRHDPAIPPFLQTFDAIFLGGAPAWDSLLDRARTLNLPIAPTYGMTETAGQIATLKPEDFLAGHSGCGQVLPHAQITIDQTHLRIQAQSLMLGYFPDQPTFQPDDLGHFDDRQSLHILGRHSAKIITGGENVFPAELEALLRASQLVTDVAVVGIPDRTWGEAIGVAYVPSRATATPAQLEHQLQQTLTRLAKYKQPKHWLALKALPRQANGKLHRPTLIAQFPFPSQFE